MSGTRYIVEIDLQVQGDLPGQLGKAGSAIDRVEGKTKTLGAELSSLGSRFASGFTSHIETVGSSLLTLGKLGIGAAIGGATYGVIGLNQQLETTRVSLAAVLNSNGLTTSIEGGMERAAAWMAQLKKDAKELPGEFEDLIGIVQSGAGAAFQAGLDERSFGDLAAQAMAAGKALSIDMPQAGRDLARLLGGSAGMDNMLGSRLGFTADNFNDKARADQVKLITEALGKFEPAIKIFGTTLDAQSSTLVDNAKTFIGAATSGLFERSKDTLAEANAWFDKNRTTIDAWSKRIGDGLVHAFDTGKAIVLEYWPAFKTFVDNGYDRFMSIWRDAKPLVADIGQTVKEFMSDDGTFDRIETILKLYIAAKAGGAVAGGLGWMGNIGGMLGAGAAAGGAGAAASGGRLAGFLAGAGQLGAGLQLGMGAGLAGYGVGTAIGGETAGTYAGSIMGGIGTGWGVGGPWGALAGGVAGLGYGAYSHFSDKEMKQQRAMEEYARELVKQADAVESMSGKSDVYSQTLGLVNTESEAFATKLAEMTDKFGALGGKLFREQVEGGNEAWKRVNGVPLTDQPMNLPWASYAGQENALKGMFDLNAIAERATKKEREKMMKAALGSGNVNIARVEITVSSNQAPGQIARDVAHELVDMRRYRRSSPNTMNVSAGR